MRNTKFVLTLPAELDAILSGHWDLLRLKERKWHGNFFSRRTMSNRVLVEIEYLQWLWRARSRENTREIIEGDIR